ncbi:TPA: 50S ribosomal protein L5 [Candidatus Sumerlaeota bacterium]|jgi:large subunit ribosomal protein L5|nr:50S ribosomal protein L5 [Candidatus Sumerlaeota bacterium]
MAEKATKESKKAEAAAGKREKSSGPKKDVSAVAIVPAGYVSRLQTKYREQVVPALRAKFEYKSTMQTPKLLKIVVNMGVGEATKNIKELDEAVEQLTLITGQKPRVNRAAVSVAQFKVRKGMPVGCCVTLRGARMYDFLDRLISVALPRVRDFRGLPINAFDGRGNHNMGVKEQLIFTEIDYNKVTVSRGMNITIVTSAPTDAECKELLSLLGMPFRKK